MNTNAKLQAAHRARLRNMVKYGAKLTGNLRPLLHRKTGIAWMVTFYWPDYQYYQIERTYFSHGRHYTKSHLISQKVLETNYVETSEKAA